MFLFSFLYAPELRTSGGMLTLFIFIDPLSVCGGKKKKKKKSTEAKLSKSRTQDSNQQTSSGKETKGLRA